MTKEQLVKIVAGYRQKRIPWRRLAEKLAEEHGYKRAHNSLSEWWDRRRKEARKFEAELKPFAHLLNEQEKPKLPIRKPKPASAEPKRIFNPDMSDIVN